MNKGADFYPFSDIEKADSLRTVQLMSACTEHIDVKRLHINGNMSVSLNRICMEQNPLLLCNSSYFLYGLYGSDLIIGKHN